MNEFHIIKNYLKNLSIKNKGAFNLNDDIFFDKKKNSAISLDTYVEGIHFLDSKNPNKFLRKVLRASLSDLYCKGIKPQSYFMSLAMNKKNANIKWLTNFNKILKKEQKKFNITLCGGDISYSSKFVITIVVLGHSSIKPILRSTSEINDDIYVTGNIGDSYLGLKILKKKKNFGKYNSFFIKKYYEPDLAVKISKFLRFFATSSIDISDGLLQDLNRICNQSKCGAIVNLNFLPFSSQIRYLLKSKKVNLFDIFSKGDDYQIIFTSKNKNRKKLELLSKRLRVKLTRIGLTTKGKSILFNGKTNKLKIKDKNMGYIHKFR